MTISTRLNEYLTTQNIDYSMIHHPHSSSSISSAIRARIPANKIAKAVILIDHEDHKLMAILPANNKVSLSAVNEALCASYHLAKEHEVYEMFSDCEHGAIPPVGAVYNMQTICDEQLDELDTVYIEAGDHSNLIRLTHEDFETIVAHSLHLRFSREVFH